MRPGASNLFTYLLVALTSPSMSGSSLEFVSPNGKFRRLEPVVDNAGASADSDALRHVSDGIRAQRAEAMGGHRIALQWRASWPVPILAQVLFRPPRRMPSIRSPRPCRRVRKTHLASPQVTTPRKGRV